jgi:hypothetical protein
VELLMEIKTIGDLEKVCAKFKNKNTPVYVAISLCEETVDEHDHPALDRARQWRFAIVSVKQTEGPMYDEEPDILDPHHGTAIEIGIHQNESLRVHGPYKDGRLKYVECSGS